MKCVFGVDIGGTTVKTALVTDEGQLLHKESMATAAEKGFADMVNRLHNLFLHSCAQAGIAAADVAGVGVGIPGFLNDNQEIVVEAVNLNWNNVPLKMQLQSAFGHIPIQLENDANVAALGESWIGAGKGANNVLCVTVGTGIGGGVVIDGQLLRGTNGMAGEIGHLVIKPDGPPCNCGHHGCLETLSSATAIIRRAKDLQSQQRISTLQEIDGAEAVFKLAGQGDTGAVAVVEEAAGWLGYGLSLAATVTNPEKIVLGGGVSYAGQMFLNPVRAAFTKYALARVAEAAEFVLAELGNDAGVIGAARLAVQSLG